MIAQGHQSRGDTTHERKDVDVIGLLMIAGLLLLIVGISFLVCWGVLHRLNRERDAKQPPPGATMAAQVKAVPEPRLLVHPGSEREKFQAAEQAQLNSYGWIDRPTGIARIPIARAMQLLVERGLPEVGAGQGRLELMQSRPQTGTQPNEPGPSATPEATP